MVDFTEMDDDDILSRALTGVVVDMPETKEIKWVCGECGKDMSVSMIVGLPERRACDKCKRNTITYEVYKR